MFVWKSRRTSLALGFGVAAVIAASALPANAAVWVPGHWTAWGGWVPGHWRAGPALVVAGPPAVAVVPPHRVWVPGHWGWGVWHPGHWVIAP